MKPQGEAVCCLDDLRLPPFLSIAKPKAGDEGDRGVFCVGVGDRWDLFEENTSLPLPFPELTPFAMACARSGGGVATLAAPMLVKLGCPAIGESGKGGDLAFL